MSFHKIELLPIFLFVFLCNATLVQGQTSYADSLETFNATDVRLFKNKNELPIVSQLDSVSTEIILYTDTSGGYKMAYSENGQWIAWAPSAIYDGIPYKFDTIINLSNTNQLVTIKWKLHEAGGGGGNDFEGLQIWSLKDRRCLADIMTEVQMNNFGVLDTNGVYKEGTGSFCGCSRKMIFKSSNKITLTKEKCRFEGSNCGLDPDSGTYQFINGKYRKIKVPK